MRLFLLLMLLLGCTATQAQNATPREVGLQFSGFDFNGNNNFSAFYKKQLRPDVYRRVRFLFGRLNVTNSNDQTDASLSAGLAWGREKRRALGDKFLFYRGLELSASGSINFSNDQTNWIVFPGIGYVLGLQHEFNPRWAINLETIPSANFTFRSVDERVDVAFSAGFSNTVSLGVVRKF